MNLYEQLMRTYMIEGLHWPMNLSKIIADLEDYFDSEVEIEEKAVEFLEYIIKRNIFYLGIGYSNPINLNINNNAFGQIQQLIKLNEEEHNVYFSLTEEGKKVTKEYIEKQIKSSESIILFLQNNEYIGFGDILKITNLEYKFNDLDEVKFDMSKVILNLLNLNLIEIGLLKDNIYSKLEFSSNYAAHRKILDEISNLKEYSKNGEIGWFRLTYEGKRVLQEYKLKGGRIRDYWKYPEL